MSATTLAADIVSKWEELSRDSSYNRENFLRNALIDFQDIIVEKTVKAIMNDRSVRVTPQP